MNRKQLMAELSANGVKFKVTDTNETLEYLYSEAAKQKGSPDETTTPPPTDDEASGADDKGEDEPGEEPTEDLKGKVIMRENVKWDGVRYFKGQAYKLSPEVAKKMKKAKFI